MSGHEEGHRIACVAGGYGAFAIAGAADIRGLRGNYWQGSKRALATTLTCSLSVLIAVCRRVNSSDNATYKPRDKSTISELAAIAMVDLVSNSPKLQPQHTQNQVAGESFQGRRLTAAFVQCYTHGKVRQHLSNRVAVHSHRLRCYRVAFEIRYKQRNEPRTARLSRNGA